jgi:hypothetical protein
MAAAAAAVTVLGTAAPASASLSSGNWTAVPWPANYFINRQTAVAPVSCVRHTRFCMVMASDSQDVRNGNPNAIADALQDISCVPAPTMAAWPGRSSASGLVAGFGVYRFAGLQERIRAGLPGL